TTKERGQGRKPTLQSLDTSIVRFKGKQNLTVDLVAAVHIGDKEYYEELNRQFKQYDAVLYELVADKEALEQHVAKKKDTGEKKSGNKSILSGFQKGMGETLQLDFQLDHVDYSAKNFVHADLSPDEFAKRVSERGDVMQIIFRALLQGMKNEKENQNKEIEMQARLFSTLFASNPNLSLKRTFARMMVEQMDDSMQILTGDGSAIITDRNAAALKVLRKEIKSGKKKIAIFYGGGHLPEFAKELKKDYGMKPVSVQWIPAWDLTSDRSLERADEPAK
ncbi:MAG: hypothetical protein FWE67_14760, partial [Planctomycetaceae bacterium]|nr:hypothetical protein [Planctomycetaceae bacterium]